MSNGSSGSANGKKRVRRPLRSAQLREATVFQQTYDERREREKAVLRREMDQKACRDALWLGVYTAELCEWPDVTAAIFEVIATVDARRAQAKAA